MQRGTCPFVQKYENARDAGAAAALIFNDGFEGREEPLFITSPQDMSIPAAMIHNDIGEEIVAQAQSGPVTLHFVVDATTTPIEQFNVTADTGGDPDRTIVVGAHLDSVEEGPGINDNGSGTSGILEIAEEVAQLNAEPRNRIRFALWGAEEAGLVGSTAYVEGLSDGRARRDRGEPQLRHDRLAELRPLHLRRRPLRLRTAAGRRSGGLGRDRAHVPALLRSPGPCHTRRRRSTGARTTARSSRTESPAGGLFTGAEGIKTARAGSDVRRGRGLSRTTRATTRPATRSST